MIQHKNAIFQTWKLLKMNSSEYNSFYDIRRSLEETTKHLLHLIDNLPVGWVQIQYTGNEPAKEGRGREVLDTVSSLPECVEETVSSL